jgi:GTPase
MLTDEIKLRVIAGRGGDGVVAFDKVKMSLGPTGGRGGNGGDVYLEAAPNLSALNKYRNGRIHRAGDGKKGRTDRGDGEKGKDVILSIPVGSYVKNLKTGQEFDVVDIGQKILAAKGGIGGRGNFYFRSPINTSPQEFEEGKSGEDFEFEIELRLIAQIGLIGLPSAGKSSLLNELTKANVKVGEYHFTTLEPNLGSMDGIIIADIPGLIEGASSGRGLGIKFLRHIRRTKVLVHCIPLESVDLKRDYEVIRGELGKYDPELLGKPEVILLTKSDLKEEKAIQKILRVMAKISPEVQTVSIHDMESLDNLRKKLKDIVKQG